MFDVDEYLVLRDHADVVSFLNDRGPARGSLVVNWLVFGTANHTARDTSVPTTRRFQYR